MSDDVLVIEAGHAEGEYWRDLWRYRGLLYFLAWRDVVVRYKQTVLGIAWALIRPLVGLVVFTLVFGVVARLPSGGVPYTVLVLSGLLPWLLFAGALTDASNSLVANANLVSKIYFPRLLAPTSAVAVSLLDFLISSVMLVGLFFAYRLTPSIRILVLPAFLLLALVAALGAGFWLAALHVRYRDVRHIVPFVVQFGLYVSPVGFSSIAVPERWRTVYGVNPMVGVIEGFRWSLGLAASVDWPATALSTLTAVLLLITGTWYFRHTERTFADVI